MLPTRILVIVVALAGNTLVSGQMMPGGPMFADPSQQQPHPQQHMMMMMAPPPNEQPQMMVGAPPEPQQQPPMPAPMFANFIDPQQQQMQPWVGAQQQDVSKQGFDHTTYIVLTLHNYMIVCVAAAAAAATR